MTNDEQAQIRRAVYLFLSPFMLGADCIATGVVVFWWLFLRGPEAAFEEIRRLFARWARFYRTGGRVWDWDMVVE